MYILSFQQMDTKNYAVVEFAEDSAVELIPASWLEETKEVLFCFVFNKFSHSFSLLNPF